jgi:hypothetical protein
MYQLSMVFEMRHALREESYVSCLAYWARLLTGFERCKLTLMNIFHMIPQFVDLAQWFDSISVRQCPVPEAERALKWVALFGYHLRKDFFWLDLWSLWH